jgi:multisubunit Na+/H+ antiporter MnhC subunit
MQLADPLPQLFALDSLLIGLSLLTLLLVLTYRAFATAPGDDLNQIDTFTAPEDRT